MDRLKAQINSFYERLMLGEERWIHFDKIGFINIGYWKGIDDSVEMAQINLIETLIKFFSNKDGNILDVACGTGASSKFLTKYFDPKKVTGINISEKQLDFCKSFAPGCNFLLMDAAKLEFDDSSFDNVICIEAALHFLTRYKFFQQAHRVLRTGGRLAMFDFLCNYDALGEFQELLPRDNYLPDWNAYRESLLSVGFRHVRVEDCTEFTMKPVTNYLLKTMESEFGRRPDSAVLEEIRKTALRDNSLFGVAFVYAIK